jgi:hypothetical protein
MRSGSEWIGCGEQNKGYNSWLIDAQAASDESSLKHHVPDCGGESEEAEVCVACFCFHEADVRALSEGLDIPNDLPI